jgi:hypothetical protein
MALPARHSTPSTTALNVLFLFPKPNGLSCSSLSDKPFAKGTLGGRIEPDVVMM